MRTYVRPAAVLTLVCLAFEPGIARADVAPSGGGSPAPGAPGDSSTAPGSPASDTAVPDSSALAAEIEIEVAFDRAGRVTRMEPALAKSIGMADTHPGFREARLLERADSSFVLEITRLDRGHLVRERQRLSDTELGALRDRVDSAIASGEATGAGGTHDAKPLFLASSWLMGLAFYGWAVPVLAEVEGGDSFAGVYLLTAGASTILPMLATHGQQVSDAAAVLWIYGSTRGIAHGAMVPYLSEESPDSKAQLGCALGFSLAEGIAGFSFAQASHMRTGSAGTYVTGGDFGLLYGLGFADLANTDLGGTATAMLLGSALGLAGARVLDVRRDYTYGDGAVMRMAGWVGGFAGVAAATIAGGSNRHDNGVALAMAGGVVGLAIGDRLVSGTQFTFGQSVVVDVSTVAGGLMGLGVGFILPQGDSGEHQDEVLTTSSSIGTMLGFALGYSLQLDQARAANADRSSWRLELSPTPPLARGDAPGVRLALSTAIPAAR